MMIETLSATRCHFNHMGFLACHATVEKELDVVSPMGYIPLLYSEGHLGKLVSYR
jgi:hypothetical protein